MTALSDCVGVSYVYLNLDRRCSRSVAEPSQFGRSWNASCNCMDEWKWSSDVSHSTTGRPMKSILDPLFRYTTEHLYSGAKRKALANWNPETAQRVARARSRTRRRAHRA